MKLNESIIKIRVELQNSSIKKSGKNKFQGFSYYELKDFLPTLNELMLSHGVNDIISIESNHATLTLVKGEERETYAIPFTVYETPVGSSNKKTMQDIQYLGALNTYYKRYLYLNAFGITDGEVIDGMNNNELPVEEDLNSTLVQRDKIVTLALNEGNDLVKALAYYKVELVDELKYKQAEAIIKKWSK
jgi:hypothetical protein